MRHIVQVSLALMLASCGSAPEPAAIVTRLDPDSVVNVNTDIEVRADDFANPAIVPAIERALADVYSDMVSGKVKPGREVKWVQVLIHVNSPADAHQKLGLIRFPVLDFVRASGNLDAADTVALREYGGGKTYCDITANRDRPFCRTAAMGWN